MNEFWSHTLPHPTSPQAYAKCVSHHPWNKINENQLEMAEIIHVSPLFFIAMAKAHCLRHVYLFQLH